MPKHLEGVDFCSVEYHAAQIASAASAAFWLDCEGAGERLHNRRHEISVQLEKLAAVLGLRLVDAEPAPRPLPSEADA